VGGDVLGSPVAQTDKSRSIVGTTTYFPYGGVYASTGTGNAAGIGYAGQSADPTGLVYMRARYFDPQLHRFISIDPVAADDGMAINFNRYAYAGNSPYANVDPSGRDYYPYYSASDRLVLLAQGQAYAGNSQNAALLQAADFLATTATNLYTAVAGNFTGDYTNSYTDHVLSGDERVGAPIRAAMVALPFLSAEGAAASSAESEAQALFYHYTTADESSFVNGLWSGSSVTDTLYTNPYQASQELGIPTPTSVIPIIDNGQFVPNSPSIVEQTSNYYGGGSDFTNSQLVPPEDLLQAQPIGDDIDDE
jgi:RHS repeat-associated protein